MSDEAANTPRWWGSHEVPHDAIRRWHIGPMTLWIQRLDREWRVATAVDEADEDRPASTDLVTDVDLMALDTVTRFAISDDAGTITLTPRLADRPVVTSPAKPLYIPPDEQVTVYVGSPLWLRIEAGPRPLSLIEFPIVRPSDTWFGPRPDDGELCYASRTSCRLDLGALSLRPHRALTAVQVKNRAPSPLLLERLNLPVVYLPLFCSAGGVLWTRDVTFDYIQGQDYAPLNYGAQTPAHADGAELVSPPRQAPSGSLVTRVFSSLFR